MILRAANEAEKRQRDVASFKAWGSPLSLEDWCDREQRLRAHRWSREVMTTWLLCGDDGGVLSSCETFRVPSKAGADSGTAYGVASVYTDPALRGRGHATRMLTLLSDELRRRDPLVHAAFLFSDVGKELYQRCGYLERPAFDWVVTPGAAPRDPHVVWLDEREVDAATGGLRRPADPFWIFPTADQVDWHLERERIYAQALRRPRPRHAGARVGASTAIWAAVIRSQELVILLFDARTTRDAERLLRAAAAVAHAAGLKSIRLWESPKLPNLGAVATRVAREGSLPMIASLNPSVEADGWRTIPRALWL